MKLIYVAGPFRGPHAFAKEAERVGIPVFTNIRALREWLAQ